MGDCGFGGFFEGFGLFDSFFGVDDVAACVADEMPGTKVVTRGVGGRVKPPMVPSDMPALRDHEWTDPSIAIRALVGVEALV